MEQEAQHISKIIAKEINSPLSIIKGKIDQIQMKLTLGTFTNGMMANDINVFSESCDRIIKITKCLTAYSQRPTNDQMIKILIEDLIAQIATATHGRLLQNQIELKIEILNSFELLCHPTQITQAVVNLISNSIEALHSLRHKLIQINSYCDNESIFILVTDSGPGIPSEICKQMMRTFYSTKSENLHLGLGLSIAKDLIESHGGQLNYNSSSDNTQFCIQLPKSQ